MDGNPRTPPVGRWGDRRGDGRGDELGGFLRARRLGLDPVALGIGDDGRRRRTPGLRREEVAHRAGIGTDWYVRLEQGRDVHPSEATLDALCRALCLDPTERTHLLALARAGRGGTTGGGATETVPPAVRRLVEGMPGPAYVTGRCWDVLCWNAAAAAVLADFGALPAADRNILVFMFLLPDGRRVFGPDWDAEARRMVARFRFDLDPRAAEPRSAALVARLQRDSDAFGALWAAHEVRTGGHGAKRLLGGEGARRFEYATFRCDADPALRLALYRALPEGGEPGTADGGSGGGDGDLPAGPGGPRGSPP